MSYQVLARKWRPSRFKEMVGQEHVLKALVNALDDDRLHHAYLFTGTRGVGKTSIARLFAKSLNCEKGVSSTPCGECSSCREIAEGRFVDLIEVDAASRTKVEDTRELLENVQYAPTHGRYKVYLIDEVHMLSTHSFNALLKTLEEPPPHVKFLLATTDPQKLPVTILSRCLQFNLKNLIPERIVKHLQFVLGEEQVRYEDPALWLLARSADGSMRDAMSLTDQAIAFGAGEISEADVSAMLGTIDQRLVHHILQALAEGDARGLMAAVSELAQFSPDYNTVLADLISVLHRVAMGQVIPDAIDNGMGDQAQITALAESLSAEDVQLYYQVALMGRKDLPFVPDPKEGMEMVLLRMLAFRPASATPRSVSIPDMPVAEHASTASIQPQTSSVSTLQEEGETASIEEQGSQHNQEYSSVASVNAEIGASGVGASEVTAPEINSLEVNNVKKSEADNHEDDPPPWDMSDAPDYPVEGGAAVPSSFGSDSSNTDLSMSDPSMSDPSMSDPSMSDPSMSGPSISGSDLRDENVIEQGVGETPLRDASSGEQRKVEPEKVELQQVEQGDESSRRSGSSEPVKPFANTPVSNVQDVENCPTLLAEVKNAHWVLLSRCIGLSGMTESLASHLSLEKIDGASWMFHYAPEQHALLDHIQKQRIETAINDYFQTPVKVEFLQTAQQQETPAQYMHRKREERHAVAVESIRNDATVQLLQEHFNAQIDLRSVTPID